MCAGSEDPELPANHGAGMEGLKPTDAAHVLLLGSWVT